MAMKTLVALGGLTVATNALENLCYKVEFDFNTTSGLFQNKQLLKPVSGFPDKHAMVVKKYCGGAKAGDPIPHGNETCTNCKFDSKSTFDSCNSDTMCIDPDNYGLCKGIGYVNGGSMFYAYGHPQSKSSNNGYSKEGASDIFFVQDEQNYVYMVLAHDKPDLDDKSPYSDGGRISLVINSTGLWNETQVVQMDDPEPDGDHSWVNRAGNPTYCADEYSDHDNHKDCFAWDNELGEGTVEWWYKEPNTDGMVLGPIPAWGFDITLDYTYVESLLLGDDRGINEFRLGSYGSMGGSEMVFFNYTVNDPEDEIINKFKVSGYTCDHYCFEAFGDTFGTNYGSMKTPVCGTSLDNVEMDAELYNVDPSEAENQYAKALVKALKGSLKDFDEEHFCTQECAEAAMEMEQVCAGVKAEWAQELVADITKYMIKQYDGCVKAAEKKAEDADSVSGASTNAASFGVAALGAALLL